MTTAEAKRIAFRHLNTRYRILAPASEATVTFPEYDPCRAVQPIAIIRWPATVNCRSVVCHHVINDGDPA